MKLEIIIFCFYFLIFGFLQIIYGSHVFNKRDVDLEVYSNRKEVAESTSEENDGIVDVCGGGDEKVDCSCDIEEKTMTCNHGLQNASLRPISENFVLENVNLQLLTSTKNMNLQKGKIFPENRETIKLLSLNHVGFGQIDAGVFDDLSSLETLTFVSSTFPEAMKIDETFLTENLGKRLLNLKLTYSDLIPMDLSIFKNLINLEELILDGNRQENGKIEGKFPASLFNLKNLEMSFCNLTFLDENIFQNLRNLEHLDLGGNNFASIPKSLKILSNLKSLSLFHSPNLISIEDCAFCGNFNLKIFNFVRCKRLTYFHENAFGAISNGKVPLIETFSIESCNISVLPERLLNWRNVKSLAITKNPFACNCSMAWLFKDLLSKNSIYESQLHASFKAYTHLKFKMGCLGEPQYSRNHTFPKTIHEVFDSCEIASSFSLLFIFWSCVGFLILAAILFFVGIYSNSKLF